MNEERTIPTRVYVDGFNLYYGAVKGTDYKWLNLLAVCETMLPKSKIDKLVYFTAKVSSTPDDPDKLRRQQTYWRALSTSPIVEIVIGKFMTNPRVMQAADGTGPVRVFHTQEKGSDVNLATYLLWDGMNKKYETAVLITDDSDFCLPVKIVKEMLGKTVIILDPQRTSHPRSELNRTASHSRPIRDGILKICQFENELQDDKGVIRKPGEWYSGGLTSL